MKLRKNLPLNQIFTLLISLKIKQIDACLGEYSEASNPTDIYEPRRAVPAINSDIFDCPPNFFNERAVVAVKLINNLC